MCPTPQSHKPSLPSHVERLVSMGVFIQTVTKVAGSSTNESEIHLSFHSPFFRRAAQRRLLNAHQDKVKHGIAESMERQKYEGVSCPRT